MKFIGDKLRIREEVLNEGFVWVRQINDSSLHVLTTGDVGKRRAKRVACLSIDDFEELSILVIDEDRDEVGSAVDLISPKGVLVDTNDRRPRVLPHPAFKL